MQTENEHENVEKKKRIEKNRKMNRNMKNDVRVDCFIETCVVENISNLIDLKTNKIIALKYDVMRVCMKSLFLELHLSRLRKNNDLF